MQRSDAVFLDRVVVENDSRLSEAVILDALGLRPGQFHQTEDLEQGVRRLYALDAFEQVSYRIEEQDEEQVLTVHTREKIGDRALSTSSLPWKTTFPAAPTLRLVPSFAAPISPLSGANGWPRPPSAATSWWPPSTTRPRTPITTSL
ncbi:hypothetical protein MBH78_01990 [Oceanimonas sp. NS1]|nr:hypothetical protein [Oceanimonas sp. NS1]